MKAPRRKVVEARQRGHVLARYRHHWDCKLSCGHYGFYGKDDSNVPAPKTLTCRKCVR